MHSKILIITNLIISNLRISWAHNLSCNSQFKYLHIPKTIQSSIKAHNTVDYINTLKFQSYLSKPFLDYIHIGLLKYDPVFQESKPVSYKGTKDAILQMQ